MMKDVNGFMMTLIGFKARIDAGKVPKANFKSMKPLLEKEHFNVETMRNKSNAAAGLCDYVRRSLTLRVLEPALNPNPYPYPYPYP